ncbi:hypothetical protein SAMN05660350_00111 [Geodermatophilus obscurus]|uniref:Transmembrane protein n=1 Tax=Geodermatophilus obscurus TaxID=1861 RepID=A0A1M7RUN1_9ACTN|nr:hypothetical protein [Geodermatophilus obscurus]SHN49732.1 hypothetical protein SAMN05660350_00111 [Geodermatophilus obscurus]
MTEPTGTRKSRAEIERRRAARRDSIPIGVAMAAAVAAFAVTLTDPEDPGDTVIWAVPMLALLALGLRAELRDLRRADEYERTLLLEALALGFVVVIVLLFVGGLFVAGGVGDPRVWLNVSFIGGLLGWSAIKAVKTRRG